MRKKTILAALESFNDDDELMMDDNPYLGEFSRICGKGQYAMGYKCVLPPGHDGRCFCECKQVHFDPDHTHGSSI